ncbi:MAG TPA: hypothetical protein VK550_21095 [Polyangiaceae bacterium]|nr:hypothetical protein [Polyangiaceae bacterium]
MRNPSLVPLIVAGFLLSGCGKSGSETSSASPAASARPAPPPSAQPTATALPAAAPPDVDVAALKKKLGCADARRSVCRVLGEFGDANRFDPRIPSGEGRWIGTRYWNEKGAEKSELMLLLVTQAPTSTVPPGELALRVGSGPVPEDKRDHGVKLASALARGDTVPRTNQTAPYVKTWKPGDARGTMQTTGNSVRLVSEELFLRQTSTKTLVVRVKNSTSGAEDVTAAELWPVSW